jgi:hypothetical protein
MIPVMGLVLAIGLAGCASPPPPPPASSAASSTPAPSADSGVLKNRTTGTSVTPTEDRYGTFYRLDSATRFYVSLTEEEEQTLAITYLMDANGDLAALDIKSNPESYSSLIKIYEEDDKNWGLNVNGRPGTFYLVAMGNDSTKHYGIVLNFRWLENNKASYIVVNQE